MIIGYARTSTVSQMAGFEAQIRDLKKEGCEKIFQEQVSSLSERHQLKEAIEFAREGDTFVVFSLDRLARTINSLMEIVNLLEKKKIDLKIINMGIDTSSPTGKLMLTLLGGIAQFEREIMLERQREGIAKAKAEGKFKGRKPLDKKIHERVLALCDTRMKRKDLAKEVGISEPSVYRIIRNRNNQMSTNGSRENISRQCAQ
jgi:DNA invertase Pin-like site-specific DNA recombinase